jgi:protein-S-isoprenylcysteine O-methyltransferase Ste14
MEVPPGRLVCQWVYRYRGYLVAPPLVFAFFWCRWEVEIEYLIWPLGIGLVLTGMVIRIWAQQHLHYRLKVRKYLTTTGPYSFVRNPIYTGNILICIGATITSELFWLIPITFLYCSWLYTLAVQYEEEHLLKKYGESYQRYLSEVPRWVPRAIRFRNLDLINRYFFTSVVAEIHCPLLLLPYIFKELALPRI